VKKPIPEKLRYWDTGSSSPDTWIDKTIKILKEYGAEFHRRAHGEDMTLGQEAFMLEFSIEGDHYRLVWPVLEPKQEKDRGKARRQAATMLHHDVKARIMYATVHGTRNAFLPMLMVPDSSGRHLPMGQVVTPELTDRIPKMLGDRK